jgi:ArsR family transcriptional regulator
VVISGFRPAVGVGDSSVRARLIRGLWKHNKAKLVMNPDLILKALANESRLRILHWLKEPTKHFRPQVYGDLRKDGVCGIYIVEKLGLSAPTVSEHLRVLTIAGLIRGKRIRQWTFYKREDKFIRESLAVISKKI